MDKKQYYLVKLEVMAPVELTIKVFAASPEEASDEVSNMAKRGALSLYKPPKPNLSRMKLVRALVYKFGTSMIKFIKKF